MAKVAVSWSGGKDSCFALYKTLVDARNVGYLLNTVRTDSNRVAFHGIRAEMIAAQADSLGIPLMQKRVGDNDYREVFAGALAELSSDGVSQVIFGDIDVQQNRAWCEDVCKERGLEAVFPLWGREQRGILIEFVSLGFKAITVCVDAGFFEKNDLGKTLDGAWVEKLDQGNPKCERATYCGENGEYHTFVFDGPIFRRKIHFNPGQVVWRANHWLVDLIP